MYEAGLSSEFRELIQLSSNDINTKFANIKTDIHNLLKIRKDMSQKIMNLHEDLRMLLDWSIDNDQFFKLLDYWDNFETDTRCSLLELWDIQLRNGNGNTDSHIDNSDDDKESVLHLINELN